MKMKTLKTKHRLVNMAIFAGIFIIVPFLFTSAVERFAPVEYFVDVRGLDVGNMRQGEWQQEISLTREVRKDLFGKTFQELRLTSEKNGVTSVFIATKKPVDPILFEQQDDHNVTFNRDWSAEVERLNPVTGEITFEPRIPIEILEKLEVGERYYWTWVFEFQTTKTRTDIVTKESNSFELLPALVDEGTTIQIESAENVTIEE